MERMYDELVERLRSYNGWALNETLDEAADAIEELMRRCEQFQYMPPPAWIPVTERLPKANQEVLVYLWDNARAFIAWIDDEGRWETEDFYIDKDYLPKAWMPLPEPPKGE